MNMIEKIKMMMDEKGLKKANVSEGSGVAYTTLDGLFKKGYENVRYPTLKKLATFFDVSLEYLMNDEIVDRNYGKHMLLSDLTQEEIELINAFRKLPQDKQIIIKDMIVIMARDSGEAATTEPVKSA